MNPQPIAKVTPDRKLEIPLEILTQLEPLTEYEVTITQDEIYFKKKPAKITLSEIRKRVKAAGEDPNQPSLEEISQVVKEVRQKLWTN